MLVLCVGDTMMNEGVTTRGQTRPKGAADVTLYKRRRGSLNSHMDQRGQRPEMITSRSSGASYDEAGVAADWSESSGSRAKSRRLPEGEKRHSKLICRVRRFIFVRSTLCVVLREPLLYPDDVVSLLRPGLFMSTPCAACPPLRCRAAWPQRMAAFQEVLCFTQQSLTPYRRAEGDFGVVWNSVRETLPETLD